MAKGAFVKQRGNDQLGAVAVVFAVSLVVLIGFVALSIEAGRWYLVRSELSKAVDAAALAGAKNISNPFVDVSTIAREMGYENFRTGMLGTPSGGQGSVSFTVTRPDSRKVQVTGRVSSSAVFGRLFGIQQVATGSSGTAEKNKVEIMMVLDRSGSMSGQPIADLKTAARSFVSYFGDTQGEDKMGLISFATSVTVDFPLQTNFGSGITAAINALGATGATNAEDALDRADGPGGFTDQTGIPGDLRVRQYLLFFTDGRPTAFRGSFIRNGTTYDAVAMGTGNTCADVYDYMGYPTIERTYPQSTLRPTPTGDGLRTSGNPRTTCACAGCQITCVSSRCPTTRWNVFSDPVYGLSNPLQCNRSRSEVASYICRTARQMAIDHAALLKAKGINIYVIGLGDVDRTFLHQVASGSEYEYYTPSSSQLQALFNKIAKEIKLRLVQ